MVIVEVEIWTDWGDVIRNVAAGVTPIVEPIILKVLAVTLGCAKDGALKLEKVTVALAMLKVKDVVLETLPPAAVVKITSSVPL